MLLCTPHSLDLTNEHLGRLSACLAHSARMCGRLQPCSCFARAFPTSMTWSLSLSLSPPPTPFSTLLALTASALYACQCGAVFSCRPHADFISFWGASAADLVSQEAFFFELRNKLKLARRDVHEEYHLHKACVLSRFRSVFSFVCVCCAHEGALLIVCPPPPLPPPVSRRWHPTPQGND